MLKQMIQDEADNLRAHKRLLDILFQKDNLEAKNFMSSFMCKYPRMNKVKLVYAKFCNEFKEYIEARNILENILKDEPKNAEATDRLNDILIHLKDVETAKILMTNFIRLCPDECEIINKFAVKYKDELKDFNKSREILENAMKNIHF